MLLSIAFLCTILCLFWGFFWVFLSCVRSCHAHTTYSWQDLTNIGLNCNTVIGSICTRTHNIPPGDSETTSWLHPQIPDAAVELAGWTIHRQDCSKASCKNRRGDLCVYVQEDWCPTSRIINKRLGTVYKYYFCPKHAQLMAASPSVSPVRLNMRKLVDYS